MSPMTQFTMVKNGKPFYSVKGERKAEVNGGSSEPLSFIDIFGDLSGYKFSGNLELNGLNLNSLKGIPSELDQDSTLYLQNNPNLQSFDSGISSLFEGIVCLDYILIKSLTKSNAKEVEKLNDLMVFNTKIDTLSKKREVLATLLIASQTFDCPINEFFFNRITLVNGNSGRSDWIEVDADMINTLKAIYRKVGSDKGKFFKAVSLL